MVQGAGSSGSCYDVADAGLAWMKGYHDAQRHFHSKGFDDSTHLADKVNYQVGYQAGWDDASKERMDRFVNY